MVLSTVRFKISTVRFKISGECRKTFSANVRYEITRRVLKIRDYPPRFNAVGLISKM